MDVDKLNPAHYNPRKDLKPGDPEYEKLKKSLIEFDYIDPIIWNVRSGRVVGGHQRLKILRELGHEQIEVSVVDLPEDKEKALNLALNKTGGDWDLPMLKDLLVELAVEIPDIEVTGFDQKELDDLINQFADPLDVQEDDFDPAAEANNITEPNIKPGEVWALGQHRLMCGDSTSLRDVTILMGGVLADMVFTDPPYNVDYEGGTGLKIQNDNKSSESFYQFLLDAFVNMVAVTKAGGAAYICHADSEGINFRTAMHNAGWMIKQCIIWAKSSLVMGRQDYQWKHEPILYGWKPGAAHGWFGGRKQTTLWEEAANITVEKQLDHSVLTFSNGIQTVSLRVPEFEVLYAGDDSLTSLWRFEKPLKNGEHPTMKPVGIPARAIKNSCPSRGAVLDLFGGSGSTLIACEQLNRSCYMMELDPIYCEVIVNRWEKYTGKTAEKIS